MVDFSERGLRTPTLDFGITAGAGVLQPFLCHPLRPAETIIGAQINAFSCMNHMVKIPWMLPTTVEMGLYVVPLSQLGGSFPRFLVGDMEDSQGFFTKQVKGSGTEGSSSALADQGHADMDQTPYQRVHRRWAGEIGPIDGTADALVGSEYSTYVPYTAASTYAVAEHFYDMEGTETGGSSIGDDDLWDSPPRVAHPINDMLRSAIAFGPGAVTDSHADEASLEQDTADANVSIEFSIADLAQQMSLMTKANQTYREYLESFGVDPRRARSMPQCVLYERRDMMPRFDTAAAASAEMFHRFGVNSADVIVGEFPAGTDAAELSGYFFAQDAAGASTVNFTGDNSPMGMVSTIWRERRNKRWFIDEPSVLIGVAVWHQAQFSAGNFGHIMSISRLTNSGHWGQPKGLDEADFLGVGALYTPQGDAIQASVSGGAGNRMAYNTLNLWLNGDSFTNDTAAFEYWTPGQGTSGIADDVTGVSSIVPRVNHVGSCHLAIATDLVN